MYIDILIEALDKLWQDTIYPDYKCAAIKDALDEAHAQKELMDYELLKGQVHIVSLTTAMETVNMALYDGYGRNAKAAKKTGSAYTFREFLDFARKSFIADATIDVLKDGFEYLDDLWEDNETYGNNNPDGTFRYNYKKLSDDSVETIHNVLTLRQLELQDCILSCDNDEDIDKFQSELISVLNAIEDLERTHG